jgi:hypothetical protein
MLVVDSISLSRNHPRDSHTSSPYTGETSIAFSFRIFVFRRLHDGPYLSPRSSYTQIMMRPIVTLLLVAPSLAFTSLRPARASTTSLSATIAVFGASGLTGQECVYQALQDGHTVVGLTRNPSKLVIPKGSGGPKADQPLTDPKLTILAGDVTKAADVSKVFAAAGKIDGVIIALGGKTADVGETMLRDGTANVISAMKENAVKRLAVVTSIGAGDSESQAPLPFKLLMWTVMKKIFVGT